MDGYILDLVTCFDYRGFTKHYSTKFLFFIRNRKMKYKKVVRLYSNSRITKYYKATGDDKRKAAMLYSSSIKIDSTHTFFI